MVPNVLVTPGLAVTGGASMGFQISINTRMRGTIRRCYVGQTSGTLDGFTYALYGNHAACPPGANPASSATVWPGLYELVPPLVVAATHADFQGTWPNDGVNHLYQGFALDADGNPGGLNQYLYLSITAAGTGAKTFAISLTFDDAVFT